MRRVMPVPDLLEWARRHDFGIHLDGVMGQRCEEIVQLGRDGFLGPDLTLIHCNDMPEEGWRRIAAAGVKVTLATTSEQQLGLGSGVPAVQGALDHGIRPCLSGDVEVCLAGDMFTQRRTTLTTQRMLAKAQKYRGDLAAPALISHRDVLEFATVRAAESIRLLTDVGTLTPGKFADIAVIRAEDLNNMPLNSAIGTIVLSTESHNVDMVFVAGAPRKWRGKLIAHDLDSAADARAPIARFRRKRGRIQNSRFTVSQSGAPW